MRRQLVARLWQSLIVVVHRDDDQLLRRSASAPGDPFAYERPRAHARDSRRTARSSPATTSRCSSSTSATSRTSRTASSATRSRCRSRRRRAGPGASAHAAARRARAEPELRARCRRRRAAGDAARPMVRPLSSTVLLLVLFASRISGRALMILLIFAYWWPILPAGDIVDPTHARLLRTVGRVRRPAQASRAARRIAHAADDWPAIARYQRAAMLEVLPPISFARRARRAFPSARSSGDMRCAPRSRR